MNVEGSVWDAEKRSKDKFREILTNMFFKTHEEEKG